MSTEHPQFVLPAPPRLVDVIPAPDEATARRIVELLARADAMPAVGDADA